MVRKIPYFLTGDDEIARIKDMVMSDTYDLPELSKSGNKSEWDTMDGFVEKVLETVKPENFKTYTVVADTANGMVGPTLEKT